MTRGGRMILAMCGALMSAALAGCPPRDDASNGDEAIGDVNAGTANGLDWPFWPTSMRIHPASMVRVDRDTGQPVIETRLEFRDAQNHVAKAVAEVTLELHDHDPGEASTEPLREWAIDLRDLAINAQHWDHVSQTYLCRLRLDELSDHPAPWFVRALVLAEDGRMFSAVRQVK